MNVAHPIAVYLPDTKGVEIARFGKGNLKIGPNVFTYSRLPSAKYGTCPGATPECEAICYAKRVLGPVRQVWALNTSHEIPPPIPAECRLLRLHISGDFTSPSYIKAWVDQLRARPDVTCWAYTRSWRVPDLRYDLERLRALPNVQLFASMDRSTTEAPPAGWRVAWIDGDPRQQGYVCPEETGRKPSCESCRYCFDGQRHDVIFLRH